MKITSILFGFNAAAVAASGVSMSGDLEDSPTVRVEIEAPEMEAREAAEWVFDLTNNPERTKEREECGWGRCRSLSVGDALIVEEASGRRILVCLSFGWKQVEESVIAQLEAAGWGFGRERLCRKLGASACDNS